MKRILSLFVACLMLVSVFAIGITNVAAAETTSWTLPMNWARDLDKDANNWELASKNNGLWRLTSFDDLDDPSTINWAASKPDYTLAPGATASGQNSLSPESYVESYNNRSYFTNVSGWADKWYVNYRQRHQKKSFEFVDNTTSINVFPGNAGYNFPAVVFTAPEAGSFNYTELVKLLISDAAVEVTVRKNGTVLTTKNATTAGETISGTVELAKGDLLMFAFELTSETTVSDSTPVINLSKVVITKGAAAGGDNTGDGGEVTPPPSVPAETKWDLPTDWRDTDVKNADGWELPIKGNWELLSYNDADGNPEDIFKAAPIGINNTATATGQPQPFLAGYKYSAGMSATGWYLNHGAKWSEVGGAIKGASYGGKNVVSPNVHNGPVAIAFTAPAAGTYNFKEALVVTNFQSSNGTTIATGALVLKYSGGNVTVLDSFVSSTTAASEKTFTGSVELAAGDQILFAFYNPLDTAPEFVNNAATEKDFYGCFITECTVEVAADDGDDNTGEGGEVTPPSGGDDDEEEITVTVGQKFISDLAIGKTVSGQFFMAGYKVADGTLVPVEPDERETWDPAWPGHFVAEANTVALFCKPEDGGAFDMNTKLDYNSAVAFKAPAKATYAIDVKVARLYALSDPDRPVNIILMKDDGTVLDKVENVQGADTEVVFDKSVALEKGEVVFVRVQFAGTEEAHKNGGFNVRLESFEVTVESVGSAGSATNPDTSDNLVLAVSALMLAAAGVVIASKKRR